MFCPNCGNQMNDNAKFCNKCGWPKSNERKNTNKIKVVSIVLIISAVAVIILLLKHININSDFDKVNDYENIEKINYVEKNLKLSTQNLSIKEQIEKATILNDLEYTIDYSNLKTVFFGNYNGKPLEWIVLRKRKNIIDLISRNVIESKAMEPATDNGSDSAVNKDYSTSALFNWLNKDFYYSSFTEKERNSISIRSYVDGEYHFDYFVDLLSVNSALNKYFKIQPKILIAYNMKNNQPTEWWLADTGVVKTLFDDYERPQNFAYVDANGVIQPYGKFQEEIIGVRPVITIKIK